MLEMHLNPMNSANSICMLILGLKQLIINNVLLSFLLGDDVDQILEENNLLEPLEDIPEEIEI